VMGVCYLAGGLLPVLPYLALRGVPALALSIGLTALALFGIGYFKAIPARQNSLASGLRTMTLGGLSGLAGYLLGTVVPGFLGAPSGLGG
jgi:vacuolar iron transporter family protein